MTAPSNPKKVASFADLARPGLGRGGLRPPVPCGAATQRVEDSTGVKSTRSARNVSVTDVLNKVTSGQADAGVVYVTDAIGAGDKVATVNVPGGRRAVNVYPIAVLKSSRKPTWRRSSSPS